MFAAMSTVSNAIKTGVFTLFVPLVVGVWVPQRMLLGPGEHAAAAIVWRVVGGSVFVAGVFGYLCCAALFVQAQGTPAPVFPTKRAVVSGPYRINRNPMYTSVLAAVFGQAVFCQQWRLAGYGVFLFVCFHLFVLLYEEPTLQAQFDGEYEDFCRRVPRWVPRFH